MTAHADAVTREQRIVDRLCQVLPVEPRHLEPLDPRSQALPAMLRRHGPVQVLLFLAAKGTRKAESKKAEEYTDRHLGLWLVQGMEAALGTVELGRDDQPDQAPAKQNAPEAPSPAAPEEDPGIVCRYAEWLASRPLPAYLLRWEVAIEVAGRLKMLIAARVEAAKGTAPRKGTAGNGPASDREEPLR
jgi:hypothetical protein